MAKRAVEEQSDRFAGDGKTTVVHIRDGYDVRIDRRSKWGNPFWLGKDGDRDTVIAKYADWIVQQPDLMAALPELRGKRLGCWCVPQACHGDVLVRLIEKHTQKG